MTIFRLSAAFAAVLISQSLAPASASADVIYVGLVSGLTAFDTSQTNPPPLSYTAIPGEPFGLAFDKSGNLFVSEFTNDQIARITPGGTLTIFATHLNGPMGLAFDSSGNLYVANNNGTPAMNANTITEITPGGSESSFASGLNGPSGLAFDKSGNLFVANFNSGTITEITTGGMQSTFASGLSQPTSLAFDKSGNLYVANLGINTITEITSGGMQSTFASGLNGPSSLAFDSSGNLFVANYFGFSITKITAGGAESTFVSALTSNPSSLAFGQSVPEPPGMVLMAVGTALAGFVVWVRRRRTGMPESLGAPDCG